MALSHLRTARVAWDPSLPCVRACSDDEVRMLATQLDRGFGCAVTSSMGRLFDAMSSLAGVCHRVAYEAEAAMRFEGLARSAIDGCGAAYEFELHGDHTAPWQLDASPVVRAAAGDVVDGVPAAIVAARFHRAVAAAVVRTATGLRAEHAINTVALSGGVFLNVLVTVLCVQALEGAGFDVLRHRLVPPSDAGLALGQAVIGAKLP